MAAEEDLQEPAVFGELSVNVIEEKEFILDPYLFALSGNNIQQYCTMLSLMEFQNSNPEMFVITEEGVETPLSLVQVVEEFEIGPYQGDGAMQTMLFDPLQQENPVSKVQLQYNFSPRSDGGVLQGKLSRNFSSSELQQGTNLQTKEYEFTSVVNNLEMPSESLQVHPALKVPMGDLDAANPQQEGSRQPTASCFTAAQPNEWIASQSLSVQSIIQDAARLNPPPGNYSGKGHHANHNVEEGSIHTGQKSQPCNKSGESSSEHMSFSVQPSAYCSITHQLAPSGERSCKCPSDDYSFSCSTGVTEHQIILTNEWERLFSRLSLRPNDVKPFKCPDCGKGYVHKSSIFRHHQRYHGKEDPSPFKCPDCGKGYVHKSSIFRHHQRYHGKEDPSLNSGQERNFGVGPGHHPHQKAYLEEKPLQCPDGEMRVAEGNAKKLSDHRQQCATPSNVYGLSSAPGLKPQKLKTVPKEKPFHCSICGKGFTVRSTLVRHQLLHGPEKPFKCLHCNKSYIQKCHLKRHADRHHIINSLSNE